jgi:MFS transporter, DHA2 family, multidrug resistance protein
MIATAVMLATFMEVLDTAIASVALPYIAGSLSSSIDEATWVLTSYLVANAVFIPASSWFALRFGRKNYFIVSVAIFTIASFFCGSAPTLLFILIARVIQGASGGALQPLSQAILMESFKPAKRGAAMAVFGFGVVVAPVLGPTLGGWLTDSYSWRYAFYINIPIGILAIIMISRYVKDPAYIRDAKRTKFDKLGFGTLLVWTGCLQVILDKGQEDNWFGAIWVRWATFFCIGALIWFIVHSWRGKDTLVDLKIFKNRNFAVGCFLIGMLGLALYAAITMLPLFYQEVLGYTAFSAGLVVGPRGFGSILGMPIIGYLGDKVDERLLLTAGFISFGICCIYFGRIDLQISPWTLLWPIVITGMSLAFVFVPITTSAYGTLKNEQMGNASGLFNLLRNIGGSIGISVAQTLITRRTAYHQAQMINFIPRIGTALTTNAHQVGQVMARQVGPANSVGPAYAFIYGQLGQQATLWAFVDVFRWMALVSFACVGGVWLLQKVDRSKKGAVAAH